MRNDPLCVITVRGKPISTNSMYATARNGRRYLTRAARDWKRIVRDEAFLARMAINRAEGAQWLVPSSLQVYCAFYGTAADVDNLLKLTLDGLKEGIGIDDKHYQEVKALRGREGLCGDAPAQGVIITIWAATIESLFNADRTDPAELLKTFLDDDTLAHLEQVVTRGITKGLRHTIGRAS